jgi:hypothetical protein
MWNDHLYAGVSVYRSVHLGGSQPLNGEGFPFNINGAAPYWRVAWQQSWGLNYLEVGTYGIYVSSVPGGVTGLHDTYADPSLDLQYERPFGVNLLTVHATFIHEISNLNATFAAGGAAESAHHLNTFRSDATYHLRSHYTFTLAEFSTSGNEDPLLYAPAPVTGSALGSPNSSGFIGQVGYWPLQNILPRHPQLRRRNRTWPRQQHRRSHEPELRQTMQPPPMEKARSILTAALDATGSAEVVALGQR